MTSEGTGILVEEGGCCTTLEGAEPNGEICELGMVLARAGSWLPLVAMRTGLPGGSTELEEVMKEEEGTGGGVSWMTDVLLCLTGFSWVTGATHTKDSPLVCWGDDTGGAGLTSWELFGSRDELPCGSANTDTPLAGGKVASF